MRATQSPQSLDVSIDHRHPLDAIQTPRQSQWPANPAVSLRSGADAMNFRVFSMSGLAWLLVCLTGSPLDAADAPESGPATPATIYFSSAPWDGAAYDIEIPLEHPGDAAQPYIRINIWGYPKFPVPTTVHFSGKEDAGGGPLRGDGRALFQANLNRSMPERLLGSVSFNILKDDSPVSGSYELATLDGKRIFKGRFQAAWGNKPAKVIR